MFRVVNPAKREHYPPATPSLPGAGFVAWRTLLPAPSSECSVAQRAERRFHKPQVVRASRTGATVFLAHRVIRPTAKDAALPTRRRRGSTGMAPSFSPSVAQQHPHANQDRVSAGANPAGGDPFIANQRRWRNRQRTGLRNPQVKVRLLHSAALAAFYPSALTVWRAENNLTGQPPNFTKARVAQQQRHGVESAASAGANPAASTFFCSPCSALRQ